MTARYPSRTARRDGSPTPVTPVTVRELAGLAWSLRRLSAAIEDVLSVLASAVADSPADTTPDTAPSAVAVSRPDIADLRVPDTEAVVAALWPPGAVSLMRDVERRPSRRNGTRYRGRVRWVEPGTGRYRGHTRTFASAAEAWAWVRTWTAPQPAGQEGQPR